VGEEEVMGFDEVEAGDGESYFCAKVRYRVEDEITRDGTKITITSTGHSWVSADAGVVKEEDITRTYVDDNLVGEETRKLLLKSIEKG